MYGKKKNKAVNVSLWKKMVREEGLEKYDELKAQLVTDVIMTQQ